MAHRSATDSGGSAVKPGALATFAVDQVQAYAVVGARGEIDLSTTPAFRDALLEATRCSARVIVDLTEVTFLDSFGIGVIAATTLTSNHDQQHGSLCLVGTSGIVRRGLETTGLARLFPVYGTVEEAVQQLAS